MAVQKKTLQSLSNINQCECSERRETGEDVKGRREEVVVGVNLLLKMSGLLFQQYIIIIKDRLDYAHTHVHIKLTVIITRVQDRFIDSGDGVRLINYSNVF